MKKFIAALAILIFFKTLAVASTSATPYFGNYADTARPKLKKPVQDTTAAGDSTATTDTAKTVHVKGYYRKDGKYVAPYTRSAPRKKH